MKFYKTIRKRAAFGFALGATLLAAATTQLWAQNTTVLDTMPGYDTANYEKIVYIETGAIGVSLPFTIPPGTHTLQNVTIHMGVAGGQQTTPDVVVKIVDASTDTSLWTSEAQAPTLALANQTFIDVSSAPIDLEQGNYLLSVYPKSSTTIVYWLRNETKQGTYYVHEGNTTTTMPDSSLLPAAKIEVLPKIQNVPPIAYPGGPYGPVEVGEPVEFDGTGSFDPDEGPDPLTYSWSFGDGSDVESGATPTHIYNEAGEYEVCLKVYDGQAASTECIMVQVIDPNLPPFAEPGGPYGSVEVGEPVEFDGTGSFDPDEGPDPLAYSWNFGDETTGKGETTSHIYTAPGIYKVCLTVNDGKDSSVKCTSVMVYPPNQAPMANAGEYLAPIQVNTAVTLNGTGSSDPDGDALTYTWSFGDGATGTGATPSHIYTAAGIYEVCLTVNDGTVDSEPSCTYVVVYVPNRGFVTGGGWLKSPAGALATDPELAGKASFGFVSKYKKGVSVPVGETQFIFQVGELNYHSTSYEWLVVNKAGSNAQFKGTGTINGEAGFGFMIWATDSSPDTFRIKIWAESNGVIIYDNGSDQPIAGGSIIVHSK